ncbi:retrovirus-related pol polyprotein from transposon TNT 1-94 [Tanacetum coccineum]|uniref:Retrovirus-related pol polyprotein from transposon TNT 1-94 n=1 Tax=Tanacetum coccineum TaxID=301880 RepID=A0ABQ4XNB5_9ASTR
MVDNTPFTKKKSSNLSIVQIYVDDIIFGSTCQDMCDEFAKIMHDEFEMSMMGELNFFLGLQIKQMEDGIFFIQSKYIKEMLKKFGLEDSKPMKTPISSDTKLTKDKDCESVDSTKYRGMIGDNASYHRIRSPNTRNYIPIISNEFDQPLQNTIKLLEKQSFHEGRVVTARTLTSGHLTTWRLALPQKEVIVIMFRRLCHMLYCIETSIEYNLAFFILRRMESIQNSPKANLPYGMLLTRLLTHIVSNFPELSNDRYILCDRVVHPLAPYYERKTRSDHGMKKCRSSNPSSSSNVLDHSSSSHHVDENDGGNDEESFHSNTPSSSQLINSLSNVVPRVFESPPHENQTMYTYQTEILNHQSQHRDEHRKGLRSIERDLKNAMRGSKK